MKFEIIKENDMWKLLYEDGSNYGFYELKNCCLFLNQMIEHNEAHPDTSEEDKKIFDAEVEHLAMNSDYMSDGYESHEEMVEAICSEVSNNFDAIKKMYKEAE
jgi:hypothetical protein